MFAGGSGLRVIYITFLTVKHSVMVFYNIPLKIPIMQRTSYGAHTKLRVAWVKSRNYLVILGLWLLDHMGIAFLIKSFRSLISRHYTSFVLLGCINMVFYYYIVLLLINRSRCTVMARPLAAMVQSLGWLTFDSRRQMFDLVMEKAT